jgi:hypothetical protein
MAVSRRTQKDIGNYEPKFIGPFTTRMAIFTAAGVVIGGGLGLILQGTGLFDTMTVAILVLIIAIGFAIFGKAKPYDMHMEDYLKQMYQYRVQSPAKRYYKTETLVETLSERKDGTDVAEDEDSTDKKKRKKDSGKPVHKKLKDFPEYE